MSRSSLTRKIDFFPNYRKDLFEAYKLAKFLKCPKTRHVQQPDTAVRQQKRHLSLSVVFIMIELADYYEVDIRELLSGERKSEQMNNELKDTLVMVADYTEEEKNKILNKVFTYGATSTVAFISLLIMFAFNLYTKSEWLNDLFVVLIYIGGAFSISTVLAGLQLQGKMSKERLKKITKIALPVCAGLMVILSVFIYFIINT